MTQRDLDALKAAYLYSQKFSQAQIANVFRCSQSTVSRHLKHAEEKEWLKFEVRFEPRKVPKKDIEEVRRFMQPAALFETLSRIRSKNRVLVRNLRVYERERVPGTIDERLIAFGRMAAGRVVELIEKSSSVGIYFGETLHRVIDGIAWSGLHPRIKDTIKIVPVAGETTRYIQLGSSSTALANRLHELVNGESVPQAYSLSSVPFLISRRGEPEKHRWLKEWVEEFPSYQAVFGGHPATVDKLDCLLTSLGQKDKALSAAAAEFEDAISQAKDVGNTSRARINQLTSAEIGGVLIPKDGLSGDELTELDGFSEAMTGLRLRHIQDLAERASHPSTEQNDQIPGMCVLAIGLSKAEPLAAILRKGLCNELIIDDELAVALQEVLESESARDALNAAKQAARGPTTAGGGAHPKGRHR